MKTTRHLLLGTLALAGALNLQAQTAVPAFEFTSPGNTGNLPCGSQDNYGFEFDLAQAVEVVGLGFYDHNQDGLTTSHPVGIYSSSSDPWTPGTLLVWTNVTPADPLTGHFRYHAIAPFTLPAGTGYRISMFVCGDLAHARQVVGLTSQPGITFVSNHVGTGGGLTFPFFTWMNSDPGFFGPNFLIAAPAPPPRLVISPTTTNTVIVSWPASATGWTLQENPGLDSAGWTASSRVPVIVGAEATVTLAPDGGARFFRLVKP